MHRASGMPFPGRKGEFAIKTVGLTRKFGRLIAVDHLNLAIPYGRIFGLLGANGAGKTTLIKMLTTLLAPTSGNAEVGGFGIIEFPAEVRRRIGYVPQLLSADGVLTGYENLRLSAKLYGLLARRDAYASVKRLISWALRNRRSSW